MKQRVYIIGSVLLLAAYGGFIYWRSVTPANPPPPLPAPVARPARSEDFVSRDYSWRPIPNADTSKSYATPIPTAPQLDLPRIGGPNGPHPAWVVIKKFVGPLESLPGDPTVDSDSKQNAK